MDMVATNKSVFLYILNYTKSRYAMQKYCSNMAHSACTVQNNVCWPLYYITKYIWQPWAKPKQGGNNAIKELKNLALELGSLSSIVFSVPSDMSWYLIYHSPGFGKKDLSYSYSRFHFVSTSWSVMDWSHKYVSVCTAIYSFLSWFPTVYHTLSFRIPHLLEW